MSAVQAIDLSNWNSPAGKAFDIAGAKARIPNLVAVMVRVTQGLGGPGTGSPDATAAANVQAALDLGLDVGGYHFLDPAHNGHEQARYFMDVASRLPGGINWRFHASCDNETAGGFPPQHVADVANGFMAQLSADRPHGYNSVYTFINFALQGYCAGLGAYWSWMAHPGGVPAEPMPWHPPQLLWWQYGQRDGVDGDQFMKGGHVAYEQFVGTFAPAAPKPAGPYRHLTTPLKTLEQVAAHRGTTVEALMEISARHYTPEDYALAGAAHTMHVPYYTNNP